MRAECVQVVSLCGRLRRQPGVIAAEASRRVQGYASSPELQARPTCNAQSVPLIAKYLKGSSLGAPHGQVLWQGGPGSAQAWIKWS